MMTNMIDGLSDEDATELRSALLEWRAAGEAHPMIPTDLDLDGDGYTDAYTLDPDDNLIRVRHVPVDGTVYESRGGD